MGAISQNAGGRQRKLWRPQAAGKCRRRRLKAWFTVILRRQPRGRLKMRRGRNSPFSTSASAISEPWEETDTQPPMTGASRPRSSTACPRASRPASPGLTRSAGSSAKPASTGRRAARSAASPSPEPIRCNASRLGGAARGGARRGDRPRALERAAGVAGERAHIGSLPALGNERGVIAIRRFDQFEPVNLDRAWRDIHHLAVAREVIGALARDFYRRE